MCKSPSYILRVKGNIKEVKDTVFSLTLHSLVVPKEYK